MFFYFLDLFGRAEEGLETVPEAGGVRRSAQPAVVGACSTGHEYECAEQFTCPPLRLLQRASAEAGVLSDAV